MPDINKGINADINSDANAKLKDQSIPRIQKVIAVIWPAFMVAVIATVLMFVLLDPSKFLNKDVFVKSSGLGFYTISFFCLWMVSILSSALTCYFRRYCHVHPPNKSKV